jgi:uncharacterized protein
MAQITSVHQLRERLPDANPMTKMKVRDHLDSQSVDFIARSPFLLLSTIAEDGTVEISPKGDEAGFVKVDRPNTLLIPDRAGNNLAFGHLNVIANPSVGLIFLLPGTGETLRASGHATLHDDEELCARLTSRGKAAKLVMRVEVARTYFHCARAILRSSLWEPKGWPEPMKVSFGKIFAEIMKADQKIVPQIDASVHAAYTPENL